MVEKRLVLKEELHIRRRVETETVEVPPGATVDILLKTVRAAHGDELGRVLDRCSFLLDEVAVRDRDLLLHDGALVDVLPPFAGG